MTDNQIAKYLATISRHCKAARANPSQAMTHIDAIQPIADHVVDALKRERDDVTGVPV